MELIVLTRRRRIQRARHVGAPMLVAAGVMVAAVVGGAFWLGFQHAPPADAAAGIAAEVVRQELSAQRDQVRQAVGDARHDLDALALRLSELQARAIRLDALGGRLVEMSGLDPAEFGFGEPPPRGGAAPAGGGEANQVPDFIAALEGLERRLELRGQELQAVQSALLSGRVADELEPRGRPLASGWISSTYGFRTDPLTGRRAMHFGVDFAGRRGSPVQSLAAGVVVFSGRRSGLGRVVEIDHGNGYVTRYAHNLKNLVQVGQRVAKGQPIAKLGSSGRSTGNHVHLEVLHNGRSVNPMPFVRAARPKSPS